jgi:hypothetical protein
MKYYIVKVSKDKNGVITKVLTRYGNIFEIMTVEEVVASIMDNSSEFYVDNAKVRLVKGHIVTSPDKKKTNNLDNLPTIEGWDKVKSLKFVTFFKHIWPFQKK